MWPFWSISEENVGSMLEVGATLHRKPRKQPATHALPAETKAITEFIQPDTQSW